MTSPPAAPLGAPAAAALPRRFGRYLLFDAIGKGGMAEIFLARQELELGGARLCVVKQIHAALSRDPSFSKMFVEEAKLCAGLRHANVVQVIDLGREGDLLFMAMEYVEGLDLLQLLRRLTQKKVPLPLELAVFVVRETLAALDFAHRAKDESGRPLGIVHRDVSPSNVLLSFEGEVKLCDFGIAKATALEEGASEAVRTLQKQVVGKSAYMAPEHARGEAIDPRADVFAAGILLWELCAGRRLYRGTEDEMLAQARAGDVPRLPQRGLPGEEGLQNVLDHALEKQRDLRYSSARAFKDALESWAVGERLMTSQIRFGSFLEENVGLDGVVARRERERAAEAQAAVDPLLRRRSSAPPQRPAALPPPSEDSTGLRKTGADRPVEETAPPQEVSVVLATFAHEDLPSSAPSEPPPADPSTPALPPIAAPLPRPPISGVMPVAPGASPGMPPAGVVPMQAGAMPAAYPPGAMSPGAMPPGAMPPGAMPPGPMPPGAMPPGATPPGVVPPAAMQPSTMPPAAPPAAAPDGVAIGPGMIAALVAITIVAFAVGFWLFGR